MSVVSLRLLCYHVTESKGPRRERQYEMRTRDDEQVYWKENKKTKTKRKQTKLVTRRLETLEVFKMISRRSLNSLI